MREKGDRRRNENNDGKLKVVKYRPMMKQILFWYSALLHRLVIPLGEEESRTQGMLRSIKKKNYKS